MPRRLLPFLLAAFAGASATSAAAPAPRGAAVRFMEGDCDQLTLPGSRGCRPVLVNLVYASGAVSFVFSGKDGRLLSFRSAVHQVNSNETHLRVDQVTIVGRGGGTAWTNAATGTCTLTAFAAGRSRVDCNARASGSRYGAIFRTSEAKPKLLTLTGG